MSFNILMTDLDTDINDSNSDDNSTKEKNINDKNMNKNINRDTSINDRSINNTNIKNINENINKDNKNINENINKDNKNNVENRNIRSKIYKNIFDEEDEDDDNENKYEKYVEPVILDNINVFPFFKKEDIEKASSNNKLLQITDKGKYSISKPTDADWITNIICKFSLDVIKKHPSTQIITDGTAGIGGNVINFSKHFAHVNSIEINNIHSNVIKNNIEALDINNVTHIHDNFLNFIENSQYSDSLFFLDPPWGGKSYKNFKYFNLKLGKLMIYDIINIFHKKGYKYLCLKAPINLNVSPILSNCLYCNYNIHKNIVGNMLLIIFY